MTNVTVRTTHVIAYRLAYSELPLPSELPTRPDAANCTPSGNMKQNPLIFIIATYAASSFTPIIPANITMNSNAHHSIHIRQVVGNASWI